MKLTQTLSQYLLTKPSIDVSLGDIISGDFNIRMIEGISFRDDPYQEVKDYLIEADNNIPRRLMVIYILLRRALIEDGDGNYVAVSTVDGSREYTASCFDILRKILVNRFPDIKMALVARAYGFIMEYVNSNFIGVYGLDEPVHWSDLQNNRKCIGLPSAIEYSDGTCQMEYGALTNWLHEAELVIDHYCVTDIYVNNENIVIYIEHEDKLPKDWGDMAYRGQPISTEGWINLVVMTKWGDIPHIGTYSLIQDEEREIE